MPGRTPLNLMTTMFYPLVRQPKITNKNKNKSKKSSLPKSTREKSPPRRSIVRRKPLGKSARNTSPNGYK